MANVFDKDRKELYCRNILMWTREDEKGETVPMYAGEFVERGDVKGQEGRGGQQATTGVEQDANGNEFTNPLEQMSAKQVDQLYTLNGKENPMNNPEVAANAIDYQKKVGKMIGLAQPDANLAVNAPVVEDNIHDEPDDFQTGYDEKGNPATRVVLSDMQAGAPGKDGKPFNYYQDEVAAENDFSKQQRLNEKAKNDPYPIGNDGDDIKKYQKQLSADHRAKNGDDYRQVYVRGIQVSSNRQNPQTGASELALDKNGNVEPQYTITLSQRGDTEDQTTPEGAVNKHFAGHDVTQLMPVKKEDVDRLYAMNGQENPMNDELTKKAFTNDAYNANSDIGFTRTIANENSNLAASVPFKPGKAWEHGNIPNFDQMLAPNRAGDGRSGERFDYHRDELPIEKENQETRDYLAQHDKRLDDGLDY